MCIFSKNIYNYSHFLFSIIKEDLDGSGNGNKHELQVTISDGSKNDT